QRRNCVGCAPGRTRARTRPSGGHDLAGQRCPLPHNGAVLGGGTSPRRGGFALQPFGLNGGDSRRVVFRCIRAISNVNLPEVTTYVFPIDTRNGRGRWARRTRGAPRWSIPPTSLA